MELYAQLAGHLGAALILLGVLFLLTAIFLKPIERSLGLLVGLPQKQFLFAVLLLAAALRVCWLFAFRPDLWADAEWYHRLAVNLSNGRGYVWDDGSPTAYLPIGYPLILSLLYRYLGDSVWVGQGLNLLLSLAILFPSYFLFRRVWNEQTARIGTLILAVSISQISWVGILFSEVTFAFLFMVQLLLTAEGLEHREFRWKWCMVAGFATGIAALIRPIALLVPAALFATFLLREDRRSPLVSRIALLYAVTFVVLIPLVVRNFMVFHAFIPISTNGGVNFWIGNNPEAGGYYWYPAYAHLTGSEVDQSRQGYALGLEWIAAHPGAAALNMFKKLFHLYHRDDFGVLFSLVSDHHSPPWTAGAASAIFSDLFYYALIVPAVWRIVAKRGSLSACEIFLLLTCVLVTCFYLIFFGSHRFHYPLYPILAGFAAAAFIGGAGSARGPQTHSRQNTIFGAERMSGIF
jgi:4-amino-4-deoxy-L-arabinose transferase-like glycosyltransferase